MLQQFFYIFIYFLFGLSIHGQDQSLQQFVPIGFSIMDKSSGDITGDGIEDVILILKNQNENINPYVGRPLLILQGTTKGHYKLLERNDSVVLCLGCGGVHGDPYKRIIIKGHYFSVEHLGGSGWRWERIITFKYDSKTKRFLLHHDAGYSWYISEPDDITKSVFNKEYFDKLPFWRFLSEKN